MQKQHWILYQYLNKDNLNKNELNHFIKTLEDFCYYLICSNGKINYLYLRDLAMYYSHLINYQPKNKTLKKELEGQLTFF